MDSTPVGTKTSDKEIPVTELTPIGAKMPDPKTPTTDYSTHKEKERKYCVPEDQESELISQTHCGANLIRLSTENTKSKDTIKRKITENAKKQDSSDSSPSNSDLSN